jgi:hypothetical protein
MFRIVSRVEEKRGIALLWLPLFSGGWRFGLLLVEPFVGGWEQPIFIGLFRPKAR